MMESSLIPPDSSTRQILVEGRSDKLVIEALLVRHQILDIEVVTPRGSHGIEALLAGLPLKLEEENLATLGVVVDADQNLSARWQAVRDRITRRGYADIPKHLPSNGWVYKSVDDDLPNVGVWVMPDNQLPGMLEDFVRFLIPDDDELLPKAEAVLQDIESAGLNRYGDHHQKALIYTWLAWQKTPGISMQLAITKKALDHQSSIAENFVDWLRRLFDLPVTSSA